MLSSGLLLVRSLKGNEVLCVRCIEIGCFFALKKPSSFKKRHLKSHHGYQHDEPETNEISSNQGKILFSDRSSTTKAEKSKLIDRVSAYLCVSSCLSFNTFQDPAFKTLLALFGSEISFSPMVKSTYSYEILDWSLYTLKV